MEYVFTQYIKHCNLFQQKNILKKIKKNTNTKCKQLTSICVSLT